MKFKALRNICITLTLLITHGTTAFVVYEYCYLTWGMKSAGYSAPPSVAIILGLPFLVLSILFLALAIGFHKKYKREETKNEKAVESKSIR